MTVGLGIAPDESGRGVDPLTHRRIIASHWHNAGIMQGLAVSGRSDLRYNVSAGCAVVSRGGADGMVEVYYPGGQTPAVTAADPSNPRIDVVWIKANDPTQGDSDNQVTVGVTQGTPSPNPVDPKLPTGALRLMSMRLPAGATNTAGATKPHSQDFAIPYGAQLGLLAESVDTRDFYCDNTVRKWWEEGHVKFYLPTDRLIELEFTASMACPDAYPGYISFGLNHFVLDGKPVPHSGAEWQLGSTWKNLETRVLVQVNAGEHTAAFSTGVTGIGTTTNSPHPYCRYSDNNGMTYRGRLIRVWDRGVFR